MAAYIIVQGRIDDRAGFDAYRAAANPTVEAHGGKLLGIGDPPAGIEGEQADLPRLVLIEFPTVEVAKGWYESPEYQAAAKLRLDSSESRFFLMEGD